MFDGVEVWGVGRQRQQGMAMFFKQRFDIGLVMERGVVNDDERVWPQLGDKALLEPSGDEVVMTASGEGNRCEPFLFPLRHNQIDSARFVIARHLAMHGHATPCPAIRSMSMRFKPALIHVNDVLRAMLAYPFTQSAKVFHSGGGMTFRILQSFFLRISRPRSATQIAFTCTPKCSARSRKYASG